MWTFHGCARAELTLHSSLCGFLCIFQARRRCAERWICGMRCNRSLFDAHKDEIELATTAADIKRIVKAHKIAAFLTVEGGHTIDDDLRVLRMYLPVGHTIDDADAFPQ